MSRILFNLSILTALGLLAIAVWVGRQPPADRFYSRIQAQSVLRVGIDPTYPPFDTLRDGKITGYDAALATALASDLGVRVEFTPVALDGIYDALTSGKVDVLVSALPFIYERQAVVRYSVPYYQSGQVLLVQAGDLAIASVSDLAGKKVGVELGSNADTEARRLARTSVPTMQLRSTYRSPEEALGALAKGDIDAAITDNEPAQAYLQAQAGVLSVISPPITDQPYVIAMPRAATRLSAAIDATIDRLRASGRLATMMGLAPAK
jgi:ABC-type amino acid transport substrate-binding protein